MLASDNPIALATTPKESSAKERAKADQSKKKARTATNKTVPASPISVRKFTANYLSRRICRRRDGNENRPAGCMKFISQSEPVNVAQ